MPSLATLPDDIASAIHEAVDGLATAEAWDGQFGEGDAAKVSFRAPAVFVAISLMPVKDMGTEQIEGVVQLRAYVVAESKRGRDQRRQQAAALAEVVAHAIQNNRWGYNDGIGPAALRSLRPMFSPKLQAKSLALWVIEFEQKVRLEGASVWDGEGVVPSEVFSGFLPFIGAPYESQYEEVTDGA